jgi:hypothetical protein
MVRESKKVGDFQGPKIGLLISSLIARVCIISFPRPLHSLAVITRFLSRHHSVLQVQLIDMCIEHLCEHTNHAVTTVTSKNVTKSI